MQVIMKIKAANYAALLFIIASIK